jgi:hypothetical protein
MSCYLCGSSRELDVRWYHGVRVCGPCGLQHNLPFLCANHGGARPDGHQAIAVARLKDGTAACPRCREERREIAAELDPDAKTPEMPMRPWWHPYSAG